MRKNEYQSNEEKLRDKMEFHYTNQENNKKRDMIENTFSTWRNNFSNQMKNEWEMNMRTKALMDKI
jgi:hypothetical protein